ncbi:MAG TPA: hypothetical protein V6C78_09335 [Crinalium sp.]|jgi:hypothetical protein
MTEIKLSLNAQIPGGPQITASQALELESYKYFDITLDKTQDKEEITLSKVGELNLLLIKATSTLAKDSLSKLSYKIGDAGTFVGLDAPLFLLGTWVSSLAQNDLKISFKLEPKPTSDSKDSVKVEILTGWQEAS